jgi:hypothetical protein
LVSGATVKRLVFLSKINDPAALGGALEEAARRKAAGDA